LPPGRWGNQRESLTASLASNGFTGAYSFGYSVGQ
jgi:hypothetical protein